MLSLNPPLGCVCGVGCCSGSGGGGVPSLLLSSELPGCMEDWNNRFQLGTDVYVALRIIRHFLYIRHPDGKRIEAEYRISEQSEYAACTGP